MFWFGGLGQGSLRVYKFEGRLFITFFKSFFLFFPPEFWYSVAAKLQAGCSSQTS
jgi:hypothetical protein